VKFEFCSMTFVDEQQTTTTTQEPVKTLILFDTSLFVLLTSRGSGKSCDVFSDRQFRVANPYDSSVSKDKAHD
jgi:hypothetical protein